MKRMHVLASVIALALLAPIAASAVSEGPYSTMHIVGDSLSDQGNLFFVTKLVAGLGIPANDHYFQGRFSNGEIYADLLATRFGLVSTATLPPPPPGGNNYAFGGARTNYNIVENPPTPGGFPPGLFPWTLNLERQAFVARGINDPRALCVVFSGSNDVGDLIRPTIINGFPATEPASNQAVEGIRQVILAFIAAGARDILVPNVPDLGQVPLVIAPPTGSPQVAPIGTALAIRYNTRLEAVLKQVEQQFPGVNIIRFDIFAFLRQVVANPGAFGLTNVTQPCYTGFVNPAGPNDTVCATPDTYLFWDAEHPTTVAHALLAEMMLTAIRTATLSDLRRSVGALDIQAGIQDALQEKLDDAGEVLLDTDAGNDHAAINILGAFINQVKAQRGKKIPESAATNLILRAQQLIKLLRA